MHDIHLDYFCQISDSNNQLWFLLWSCTEWKKKLLGVKLNKYSEFINIRSDANWHLLAFAYLLVL
jgi:hypothetical protein